MELCDMKKIEKHMIHQVGAMAIQIGQLFNTKWAFRVGAERIEGERGRERESLCVCMINLESEKPR